MPMNTTLGVALITSLSTLSAGLLASVTSLRIQRRQTDTQLGIALSEQAERKDAQHRQLRRDSYVQLLTRFDEVTSALQSCWERNPPTTPDEPLNEAISQVRNLLSSLDASLNIVLLEGPQSLANAARDMQHIVNAEFDELIACTVKYAGKQEPLFGLVNEAGYRVVAIRYNAKAAFIEAAQEVLETAEFKNARNERPKL